MLLLRGELLRIQLLCVKIEICLVVLVKNFILLCSILRLELLEIKVRLVDGLAPFIFLVEFRKGEARGGYIFGGWRI
jgi:hypothetical protein